MGRGELERLSKEELIELVLRLQRPEKTSRTSSKPPSTDRKEQRERSKPGGAKPGHEGHSRVISETPDEVVEHRPDLCPCCLAALPGDLAAETVSVHERVELPAVKPLVTHHRRLAVGCPACGTRVVAPVPEAARGTPFGPRLHAVATYLKTFQALSYERLQAALSDLFGALAQPGRPDEPAAACAGAVRGRAEERHFSLAAGRDGRLGRDRRQDRGRERLPLGLSRARGGGAPRRADPGGFGGPGHDGRTPPRALALGPLCRPAGARGGPPDLSGSPGA